MGLPADRNIVRDHIISKHVNARRFNPPKIKFKTKKCHKSKDIENSNKSPSEL